MTSTKDILDQVAWLDAHVNAPTNVRLADLEHLEQLAGQMREELALSEARRFNRNRSSFTGRS